MQRSFLDGLVNKFCADKPKFTAEEAETGRGPMSSPMSIGHWKLHCKVRPVIRCARRRRFDTEQIAWFVNECARHHRTGRLWSSVPHTEISPIATTSGSKYISIPLTSALTKNRAATRRLFFRALHQYQRFTRPIGIDRCHIIRGGVVAAIGTLHYLAKQSDGSQSSAYQMPDRRGYPGNKPVMIGTALCVLMTAEVTGRGILDRGRVSQEEARRCPAGWTPSSDYSSTS